MPLKPRFKFKKIFVDAGTFEISPREKELLANMTPAGRDERIRQLRRSRAVPSFAWEKGVERRAKEIEKELGGSEVTMDARGRKKVLGKLDAVPPYLVTRGRGSRRERSHGRRD